MTVLKCDLCAKDLVQYKHIIIEQKLQIEALGVHIDEVKIDFNLAIGKVKLAYSDLEKSIKKHKFKAWVKGVWQGAVLVVAIIVTVLVLKTF